LPEKRANVVLLMNAPTRTRDVGGKVHTVAGAPLVVSTRNKLEEWVNASPAPFVPVVA
jgi:hypothetical protein